ncbi:MAG: NRDE family protein [Gammaproteobacteria bacterium]|nr:NRDE family protein [Gammaproteobacteria bacterium]
MCLIAFAINQHKHYPLIILANRDEFFARPTKALAQWIDNSNIIGGQDLEAGGTWLAVSPSGKWAALTNFRNPAEKPKHRSRGEIIKRYLSDSSSSKLSTKQFIEELQLQHEEFNGFNLVLGDLAMNTCFFISNHPWSCSQLNDGVYTISNGPINNRWPKMENFHQGILQLLTQNPADFEKALALMTGSIEIEEDSLPNTGISRELEKSLAQPFIQPFETQKGTYGTRSSALVLYEQKTTSAPNKQSQNTESQWLFTEYQHQTKETCSLTCPISFKSER